MNYLRNSYRQSLKSNLQLAYFLWVATREVIAQTILLKLWVLCLEEGPDCVTVQRLQVGLKREQLWLSFLPTFIWPATTCKCSVLYPLLKEGPHPVAIHKQELKWSLVTLSAHYSKQCLLSCERQPVNHAVTTVSRGLQNQKQRIPALNNYKTAPPSAPPPPHLTLKTAKDCQIQSEAMLTLIHCSSFCLPVSGRTSWHDEKSPDDRILPAGKYKQEKKNQIPELAELQQNINHAGTFDQT